MTKIKLNEAPDEYGLPTDDELEQELAQKKIDRDKLRNDIIKNQEEKNRKNKLKASRQIVADKCIQSYDKEMIEDYPKNIVAELTKIYISDENKSDIEAGEYLRALNKLLDSWFNHDIMFMDTTTDLSNMKAAAFLYDSLSKEVKDKLEDIAGSDTDHDNWYKTDLDELCNYVCKYILIEKPESLIEDNTKNYLQHPIDSIKSILPKFDLNLDYPKKLEEHHARGNITLNDIENELNSWDEISSCNAEVICYSSWIEIIGLSSESYTILDAHGNELLQEYVERLDEEFGDPSCVPENIESSYVLKVLEDKYKVKDKIADQNIIDKAAEELLDYFLVEFRIYPENLNLHDYIKQAEAMLDIDNWEFLNDPDSTKSLDLYDNYPNLYRVLIEIHNLQPLVELDIENENLNINSINLNEDVYEDEKFDINKYPNIKRVIDELNKSTIDDSDDLFDIEEESQFKFKIWDDGQGHLCLADTNENYNINYEEDMNYMLKDCAEEFGYKFEPYHDIIRPKLEAAAQLDLSKDAYLEWYDSVVMWVVK